MPPQILEFLPRAPATSTLRRFAGLPYALCALLLTGCGLTSVCSNENQPYLEARELPPLRVPAGMDAPNKTTGFNIPPLQAETPRPQTARLAGSRRCIDEAPSYFGTALSPLSSPEEIVAMWAQAWSERNTDLMMAAYSEQFEAPEGTDSAAWLEQRREQVATGPVPRAGVQGLRVGQSDGDRRIVTFAQRFDSNTIRRELTFVRENAFWRIIAERVIDLE